MTIKRRKFIKTLAVAAVASQLPIARAYASRSRIKPPCLKPGDTIGLIAPAGIVDPESIEPITQKLATLGWQVKLGNHLLDRYGYLAGKDSDRAADVNSMFADKSVQAILAVRGGWGCNRILPLLNYKLIRNHPKIIMGLSDITALLLAIYAKTNVITFHGLTGTSTWNEFSLDYLRRILFNGEAVTMQNPTNTDLRVETIRGGTARGKLVGGNLSVLAAMVGSSYLPKWQHNILFLEDIREEVYRIDRMLTQLELAGILPQISGFVFGNCRQCDPEEPDKSLTLMQVLQERISPLGIPAWYGAAIGHIPDKFTLPIGVEVEIDATAGTIKMLEAAVK
ncbi:S66 peptidase family protein [Microseira wollei]|uniref:Peptidase U61, LD-carboxypeptidase A n=1 Tax=Microseira wollei NIES-4236 TaxID=2530354 RepID=A0AAV3XC32_9CYAN|nr:LD-carboxypeptidase [Microseira wollei]GET38976.1 peptidase U61, LD-carboxypeptidase A [Microseira wollei NIES-4236]